MSTSTSDLRRRIPAVDRLLAEQKYQDLVELYGSEAVVLQLRLELDGLRRQVAAEAIDEQQFDEAVAQLAVRTATGLKQRCGAPLRRVINATGILLHTNLGRAALPSEVATQLPPLQDAYCDLEIDLDTGRRGDRNQRARRLLTYLTGAESAVVTNNNAAALVLALATLAPRGQVVVSRGELVEIGGSFRIPNILEAAGSELVEVGTTNRTRLEDYEQAIGPDTAMLLKVHPSNYRISGFIASVSTADLVDLGRRHEVPVVVDEGSGMLRPDDRPQLRDHESLAQLLEQGCDLVCGSGDKLLGGPQAGLLLGKKRYIDPCRKHPLYRALRPDRATFASLDAVLRRHLTGKSFPLDRLWAEGPEHQARLERVAQRLGARIQTADAYLGGGAAPDRPIEGKALALEGEEELLRQLRVGDPAVVGYLRQGSLILDLRTVEPGDDEALVRAVESARQQEI